MDARDARRERARDVRLERAWRAVEAFAATARRVGRRMGTDDDDDDDDDAFDSDAAIQEAFTELRDEDDPRVLLVETSGVFLGAAAAMRRVTAATATTSAPEEDVADADADADALRRSMTHACVMFIRAERAWGERRMVGARVKSARAEQLEYEGVLGRWLAWALEECERADLQSYVLENSARDDALLGCVIHALFVDVNADDPEVDDAEEEEAEGVARRTTRTFRANSVGVAYLEEKLLTQTTRTSPEPLMREVFLRGFTARAWLAFVTRAFDRVRTLTYDEAFVRAESYATDVVAVERASARRGALLAMYLNWLKDVSCCVNNDVVASDADADVKNMFIIDALAFVRDCLEKLKERVTDDYSFTLNVTDAACNTAYVLVNHVRDSEWDVDGLLGSVRDVVDAVRACDDSDSGIKCAWGERECAVACVELASENLCRILRQRVK